MFAQDMELNRMMDPQTTRFKIASKGFSQVRGIHCDPLRLYAPLVTLDTIHTIQNLHWKLEKSLNNVRTLAHKARNQAMLQSRIKKSEYDQDISNVTYHNIFKRSFDCS